MLNKDGHFANPRVFKDLASPRFGVSAGCEMMGEVGSLINNSNKRESYGVNKPSATKGMPFGGGHGKAMFRLSGSPKDCLFASSAVPFQRLGCVGVHKP